MVQPPNTVAFDEAVAAAEIDGRLILAGEANHQAVFWIGETT